MRASDQISMQGDAVRLWTERVTLPTYKVAYDPVPRLAGTDQVRYYPYSDQHEIATMPVDHIWTLVCMENEYLIVKVLPQLGGRVYSIYDKRSSRDALYRPTVIKPTTSGIRGAWICGGIEYNFPDCHTVTTHDEVHWTTRQYPDGSAAILVGDVERISHMAWSVEFRLVPGYAGLLDRVKLYNRTEQRQRYFYWTNACVESSKQTQVIFPFRKCFVGNGQTHVKEWPIQDGRDASYCSAYDEGTSVGGLDGAEDFFGAFDHAKNAGLVYWSDHQALPARKFWTWGTGNAGKYWASLVSDDGRSYLELQAGPAVTANEYAWALPGESATYEECWIPVSGIGPFSRANPDAVVRLSRGADQVTVGVLPLRDYRDAQVELLCGKNLLASWNGALAPDQPLLDTVDVPQAGPLHIVVRDAARKVIIEHYLDHYAIDPDAPKDLTNKQIRRIVASTPAGAARRFEVAMLDNQITIAAEAIEKAIARWPDDLHVRLQAGLYRLFQGKPKAAAEFLEPLVAGSFIGGHGRHPETADPAPWQAAYNLALAWFQMGQLDRAAVLLVELQKIDPALPQARTWIRAARVLRARLLINAGRFQDAFALLVAELRTAPDWPHVAALAAYAARLDKGPKAALQVIHAYLPEVDLEPMARLEVQLATGCADATLQRMLLRDPQVAIDLACDYIALADWSQALGILTGAHGEVSSNAMTWYMAAWCAQTLGRNEQAHNLRVQGAGEPIELVMPSRVEELLALQSAMRTAPDDRRAAYYAGLVLMRLMRVDQAIQSWQRAIDLGDDNPLVRRCLGMSLARVEPTIDQAIRHLARAIELCPDQPQFYRDLADLQSRLRQYPQACDTLARGAQRTRPSRGLLAESAFAYLTVGQYGPAIDILSTHRFGASGTRFNLAENYEMARLGCGLQWLVDEQNEKALADFDAAMIIPSDPAFESLQGNSLQATIDFWRAMALQRLRKTEQAHLALQQAAHSVDDEQVMRHGYPGMLNVAHGVLALRLLGDEAGFVHQMERFNARLERMRRWERSDWGKGLAMFCRTWIQMIGTGPALDVVGIKSLTADPHVEPQWSQLSRTLAEALETCKMPEPVTTQPARP